MTTLRSLALGLTLISAPALATPTIANAQKMSQYSQADAEALAPIIRQYILDHPEVLHQSLYEFQAKQEKQAEEDRRNMVKSLHNEIYNNPHDAFIGPKDSKKVVVEFFDYNCGACKMMFRSLASLLQEDKTVKVIFKEYPIFGDSSVENARFGLAIHRLYPDKYKEFHGKMLAFEGRIDINQAVQFASTLGMDIDKLRKEAAKPEILDILSANKLLGEKLQVDGTPTLVINDEVIGSAPDKDTLKTKLNSNTKAQQ